jgi:hypothetical protein
MKDSSDGRRFIKNPSLRVPRRLKIMPISYPKLVFAALFTLYFLSIVFKPLDGSFLDLVDLPIHETGHLLFRPFGEFMMVAGGSLFQIVVPAAFVGYFARREKYYSASIVLFWVGQSMLNVFVYAGDAQAMRLVLTSGLTGSEGGFHDWNYLLTQTGFIKSTATVANLIRLLGTLTILAAGIGAVYYSIYPQDETDL